MNNKKQPVKWKVHIRKKKDAKLNRQMREELTPNVRNRKNKNTLVKM